MSVRQKIIRIGLKDLWGANRVPVRNSCTMYDSRLLVIHTTKGSFSSLVHIHDFLIILSWSRLNVLLHLLPYFSLDSHRIHEGKTVVCLSATQVWTPKSWVFFILFLSPSCSIEEEIQQEAVGLVTPALKDEHVWFWTVCNHRRQGGHQKAVTIILETVSARCNCHVQKHSSILIKKLYSGQWNHFTGDLKNCQMRSQLNGRSKSMMNLQENISLGLRVICTNYLLLYQGFYAPQLKVCQKFS